MSDDRFSQWLDCIDTAELESIFIRRDVSKIETLRAEIPHGVCSI
jgi:hypothetical protein